VLGIRPECIAAQTRHFDGDPAATLLLDLPVEMTEPTGAETIVLLRLAGHEVLGRISPDIRLRAGATARFAVDTRKICLFDPQTERLIAYLFPSPALRGLGPRRADQGRSAKRRG
jgi:multiple sugar transport system ATP-binding protein